MKSNASPSFKLAALAIAVLGEIALTTAWILLAVWIAVKFAPVAWWQVALLVSSVFVWAKAMEVAMYRLFLRLIGAKP